MAELGTWLMGIIFGHKGMMLYIEHGTRRYHSSNAQNNRVMGMARAFGAVFVADMSQTDMPFLSLF